MHYTTSFYLKRLWSFSHALDLALVDEEVERGFKFAVGRRHGERVAYIALMVGKKLELSNEELLNLTISGLIHDIGAIANFRHSHGDPKLMLEHSLAGSNLVKSFPMGDILSQAVKYHHETPNVKHDLTGCSPDEVPLLAKILSLADKIDVHLPRRLLNRSERGKLLQWINELNGDVFFPEVVIPFMQIASRESFWLDLEQTDLAHIVLTRELKDISIGLSRGDFENRFTDLLADTFAELVDQKSNFTARHSHLVADTVKRLAQGLGWQENKVHEIYTAGLLHDLGKLAVPNKVLDKPGKLDEEEIEFIRSHTYFTYHLLDEAGFPQHMIRWAAFHHERLDGKGYPFEVADKELDEGSRLMVIADYYAALTEERPYRKALSAGEAFDIIKGNIGLSIDPVLFKKAQRIL